jgi:hypothetical protein
MNAKRSSALLLGAWWEGCCSGSWTGVGDSTHWLCYQAPETASSCRGCSGCSACVRPRAAAAAAVCWEGRLPCRRRGSTAQPPLWRRPSHRGHPSPARKQQGACRCRGDERPCCCCTGVWALLKRGERSFAAAWVEGAESAGVRGQIRRRSATAMQALWGVLNTLQC